MRAFAYRVQIEPDDVRGFRVTVPTLPGCTAHADSYPAALLAIQAVIERRLKWLALNGHQIPEEDHHEQSHVAVVVEPLLPVKVGPVSTVGTCYGRSISVGFTRSVSWCEGSFRDEESPA